MEQSELSMNTFECDGTNVTVFFSDEGKQLQECMVDVLNVHMEKQSQT